MIEDLSKLECIPLYSKASIITVNSSPDCWVGDIVTKLAIVLHTDEMLIYNHRSKIVCKVKTNIMHDVK